MLRKLIDEQEEKVLFLIKDSKLPNQKSFKLTDLFELLITPNVDSQNTLHNTIYNNRSIHFLHKALGDYLVFDEKDDSVVVGFSELYVFAKQIRNLFKYSKLPLNDMTMTIPELEFLYQQAYVKNGKEPGFSKGNENGLSCLPYKRLGFIDINLLFSQGINLLVTVKKYAEKRICLNREFWCKLLKLLF